MTSKGDRLSLPFMLSQTNSRQQTDGGDVSEITSPFEEENRQSYGSSLFSRLSRGQRTSPKQDRSQSSQSSPEDRQFDYLSTINSAEESIHREESKSNSSVPDKQPQRVQGTGADYSLSNSRANDESYSMMFSSNENDKSISWEISPMKEHKTTSRGSISTGIQSNDRFNTTRPQLEVTMITSSTDTSSRVANENEWRQVDDVEGRTYYYNRKTRVSKWHLPPGAVVVKRKVSSRSYDSQLLRSPKQPMSRQLNHSQQNDKSAIANHSPAKVKISKSQQSVATYDDHDEHKEGDCDSYSSDGNYSSVAAEEESLEISTNRLQIHDIKSPQDPSPALYCVYCGVKCDTATVLGHHLTSCKAFEHMQVHGQSTQMEIESLLFKAWSQIGNSTGVSSIMPTIQPIVDHLSNQEEVRYSSPKRSQIGNSTAVSHSFIPTTIQPSVDHSFNQEEVRYSSPKKFEASYDNETFIGNDGTSSYEQTYVAATPPKTPTSTRKARREVENVYCVEKKSCPFCQLEFNKGNELSSHLLKCKARKSARKQRRKKKESPPVSPYEPRSLRKPVTPGRRMPVSFESGLCIYL